MIEQLWIRTSPKAKYMTPVESCTTNKRTFLKYGFNAALTEELKSMEGTQFHGYAEAPNRDLVLSIFKSDKVWSVADSQRNRFQLDFLQGKNPYKRWDEFLKHPPLIKFTRPLRKHQCELATHGLTVHYGIWAAEMGTGKTLAAIEVMERSGAHFWYVAPKSAIRAVQREFQIWGMKNPPTLMTYNELVKRMKDWKDGDRCPQGVFFDESQKIKTPSAQRSVAAKELADGIREDWGDDGYVILMSGSPAPKSPVDWWHQCEVAYPGFLKEGTVNKFKFRLGLHETKDSFAGGQYAEHLTWLDDARKCKHCGKFEKDVEHSNVNPDVQFHEWEASENEVERLYRRMRGLVVVKFKKDCLDLPDKQYRVIKCPIMPSTIRSAKLISGQTGSVAKSLILLRELSDGFQYVEVEDGEKVCELCNGKCTREDFKIRPEFEAIYEETGLPPNSPEDQDLSDADYRAKYYDRVVGPCSHCAGRGQVTNYRRDSKRIPCPKDDAFKDLLDEHDDVGRLVVYAGFTESVTRCVEIAQSEKWAVIKWDGTGIKVYDPDGGQIRIRSSRPPQSSSSEVNSMDSQGAVDPLTLFQEDFKRFPRVCFIGNAGAAGTGLTLTASPSICYYSNSFNAEDRIQSEDRIHRIGMDTNRGATIIDLVHLPTDAYILANLKKKRDLQDISMGELSSILESNDLDRLF